MVLKTGNLELASYCVRHAADLNAALGGSPTQQAIVQTFLKNYSKVGPCRGVRIFVKLQFVYFINTSFNEILKYASLNLARSHNAALLQV